MKFLLLALAGCATTLAPILGRSEVAPTALEKFRNPLLKGADPWVVRHEGAYYWCFDEKNLGVAIHRSTRLTEPGEKTLVWHTPATGPHSRQLWAPDLHFLDGRAYVYGAASDGHNATHRMIVLESVTADPLGAYTLKAELYTGDNLAGKTNNRWAIDGTVLELAGRRCFIWSGWEDERDVQWLYIATMANPWTLSSNRVRLCANDDYIWERVEERPGTRGLHEGPQVLQYNGRTFVVYSTSASWRPSYKLGMLELQPGADPMQPASWKKFPEPVFVSTEKTFGVGHGSFTRSPDGTEWWLTYHAKVERSDGWNRVVHLQPFTWTPSGLPNFGYPVDAGVALPLPAGEPPRAKK
jgi:GH43 family beta-xylosidase